MKKTPTLLAAVLLTACSAAEPEQSPPPPPPSAEPVEEPAGRPGRLELIGNAIDRHHAGYSFARGRAVADVDDGDLVLRFDWEHPRGVIATTGDQPAIFALGKKTWAELLAVTSVPAGPPLPAVPLATGTAMIVRLRDESHVLVRFVDVTPSSEARLTAGGMAAVSFEWGPFPARPASPPDPLPPDVAAGRIVLENAARRSPMRAGYSFKVMRADRFDPDLNLFFNDDTCAQGAIVSSDETPELYVLGSKTWPELAVLTGLPTGAPVRKVVPTPDLVGVALLVTRRRGLFALVRVTAVEPATFDEVNAGAVAAIEFEWAPFTPKR